MLETLYYQNYNIWIDFFIVMLINFFRTMMKWTKGVDRPANGSLVQLVTKNNETKLVIE